MEALSATHRPEIIVKPLHGETYLFWVAKDTISIGRSKRNDLVLVDQWLSRHHAEIRFDNARYIIRDLESRNGTIVNGLRIERDTELHHRDIVILGDQTLTFINKVEGTVILSDTPSNLDEEGTVIVPTKQLLANAQVLEDTWDNMVKNHGATAENLRDESAKILKRNQMLTALSQASLALISNRPVNQLLDFVLELAFNVIKAERGVLMLATPSSDLEAQALRDRQGNDVEEISFSQSIADKVVHDKVSILTKNAMTDPRFCSQDSIVSAGIRSAMCVPLWNNEEVTGLIYVDSLIHENIFTHDDLMLLTSLANVAAVKIENAKLLEEMMEKKRMQHELARAADIQQNLLPTSAPVVKGWDLSGSNTPCYTIGGDYYDFIPRQDHMVLALGDVSGKGADAALMMMVLRATLHLAIQHEDGVESAISLTNRVMLHNSPPQFYVTFFLGDLDPTTGTLRYINAGHIPPILYRKSKNTIERLNKGGTVLGLFDGAVYEEGETNLLSGDILVVFTDGISESWNNKEEEFGENRVSELIKNNPSTPAAEILNAIHTAVDRHTNGSRATDDKTLIVVKRN